MVKFLGLERRRPWRNEDLLEIVTSVDQHIDPIMTGPDLFAQRLDPVQTGQIGAVGLGRAAHTLCGGLQLVGAAVVQKDGVAWLRECLCGRQSDAIGRADDQDRFGQWGFLRV